MKPVPVSRVAAIYNSSLKGLVVFVLVLVTSAPAAATQWLNLEGGWQLEVSNGTRLDVQAPGSWRRQGIAATVQDATYVRVFQASDWFTKEELGLQLGLIYPSWEVSLNGELIGKSGSLGRPNPRFFVDVPLVPVVIPLPQELLRHDADNELRVRVIRSVTDAGMLRGPLRIGALSELRLAVAPFRERTLAIEASLLAVDLLVVLAIVILLVGGTRQHSLVLFALIWLPFLLTWITHNRVAYESFGISWQLKALLFNAIPLGLLLIPDFFARMLERTVPRTVRWLQMALLANTAPFLLAFFGALPSFWIPIGMSIWFVGWGCLSITAFIWAVQGIGSRQAGAWPLAIGSVGAWLYYAFDLYMPLPMPLIYFGVSPIQLGARVFWMACIYVGVSRYVRLQKQNLHLSGRILDAQEQERTRLARDLHDSVGQAISSIKLRLDMYGARNRSVQDDALVTLSAEAEAAISEVRRVSADLRPAALENESLGAAIDHLAAAMSNDATQVLSNCDRGLAPDPRIGSHLYRIAQEAIRNATEHGGAKQVFVTLTASGDDAIALVIEDDGRGLQGKNDSGAKQLGLQTIAERAQLLGGRAQIDSVPGQGTTVKVRVPRD